MTINTHPSLFEFDYVQPATLAEACEFLASHAVEARPFLGGTDVFVRMRDGFLTASIPGGCKKTEGLRRYPF